MRPGTGRPRAEPRRGVPFGRRRKGGPMPTEAKRETVAELTQALQGSKASIVADYRGLTMSDLTAVRRALRDKGIQYRVVKNRLAKIAATDAGVAELVPLLEGPSAIALGAED